MNRKLIFINRFFYPDYSATSQILSDLAFDLAGGGEDVKIITSRQFYDSSEEGLKPYEIVHGVKVFRVWTSKFGRSSLVGRSIDYFSFYIFSSITLWRNIDENTTVVVKTDPPLISVVVAPIVWAKRGKLINWLQDMFPEVAFVLDVKLVQGFTYKLLKYLRNKSLKFAEMNIVLGEAMANHLRREGIPVSKVSMLPNWADSTIIKPVKRKDNALRKKWGLEGKLVVGYSGNFGRAHEFETIIKAAELLRSDHRIVFLFIGGGAHREKIESLATEFSLKSIMFKPYQPRDNLSESLSCADVHLISLNPRLEGLIVPSKVYGVLAAGRPSIFIGDAEGEISRLLNKYECGYGVASGDAEMLACLITGYTDEYNKQGENARLCSLKYFNRRVCVSAFREVINDIR